MRVFGTVCFQFSKYLFADRREASLFLWRQMPINFGELYNRVSFIINIHSNRDRRNKKEKLSWIYKLSNEKCTSQLLPAASLFAYRNSVIFIIHKGVYLHVIRHNQLFGGDGSICAVKIIKILNPSTYSHYEIFSVGKFAVEEINTSCQIF